MSLGLPVLADLSFTKATTKHKALYFADKAELKRHVNARCIGAWKALDEQMNTIAECRYNLAVVACKYNYLIQRIRLRRPVKSRYAAICQPMNLFSTNITPRKQLEQRLNEARQQAEHSMCAKELLLANMSHEIRTPMNAILGMSQSLAKTELAPRQSNYLHAIITSAQNLLVIINDILDLSKLDAGKMTIEHVGFNVTRLMEQGAKTLLYKAEEKVLQLITHVNSAVHNVVVGDPYRITQVLLNLASNSVKFTEKGEVRVDCEVAGYY